MSFHWDLNVFMSVFSPVFRAVNTSPSIYLNASVNGTCVCVLVCTCVCVHGLGLGQIRYYKQAG